MCDQFTVPCMSFLSPDRFLWSVCFRSMWIYELPYSLLQLMTWPVRINEDTAWAKKRKQWTAKWMKQKWFPSRKSSYAQLLTEELLYTTITRDRPHTSLKVQTIRDGCVTKKTATHLDKSYVISVNRLHSCILLCGNDGDNASEMRKTLLLSTWSQLEEPTSLLQFCSINCCGLTGAHLPLFY